MGAISRWSLDHDSILLDSNMKIFNVILVALSLGTSLAHPEKLTAEKAKAEARLIGRSTNQCAAAIEKRKADILAKRASRLQARHLQNRQAKSKHASKGHLHPESLHYTTIQNDTCVLAPDTVWGPYG